MAKRNRSSNRPGQRHPDRLAPGRSQTSSSSRPAQGLSDTELARAAELESQIVAQEKAAQAAAGRSRTRVPEEVVRGRGQSPLSVRAAEEYNYLTRDVRRIVTVGALMAAILFVFVVLIDILHVITL